MENPVVTLDLMDLQSLIDALTSRGYTVLGPAAADGAITYRPIHTLADLPRGVGDDQDAAHYRLTDRGDDALFGYAAGAQSLKPLLFPPDEMLWLSSTGADGPVLLAPPPHEPAPPYAVVGVRACDARAVAIHDQVLTGRVAGDVHYAARRAQALLIGVTCSAPGGTCFCAHVGAGPVPGEGCDIVLTELLEPRHRFVGRAVTPVGQDLLAQVHGAPSDPEDLDAAEAVAEHSRRRMGREVDTDGLRDLLYGSAESSRWDDVAGRCLACTNCTMVCPTCFCTTVTDHTDLAGTGAERHRVWDSCFVKDYSYIHGGPVRESGRARYRQWLTHKFASWQDQFGELGCVGCGRCITWCPAGIDLTAQVAALRADDRLTRRATR